MLQVIQSTINQILFKRNSSSYGPLNYIRTSRRITDAGLMACTSFILLTLAILIPPYLVPENIEAATGTATESSITFTSTSSTASATLDVTSINGNFATSTSAQQIAFSLSTTNYTGYTLKLKLSDSTNTLSNGSDILAMITNSTTSDNFTNNSWGLLPSKYNSNDNTNTYYPITTTGITMHETTGANSTANNYTISLGLKADYSKSAGTYTSNKVILEYIANPVNYVITYNKNTTDAVTNMPYSSNNSQQAGDTSATTITLSSLVPVRDGYSFKGWCSVAVSDNTTCSSATYNPDGAGTNLSYGIDQTTMNEGAIYAMWENNAYTIDDVMYMQDVTAAAVINTAEGATTTLFDIRDGQGYMVTKINGGLWMTRNLAIGCNGSGSSYGSNINSKTLTSADSNVVSDWSTPIVGASYSDYAIAGMTCSSTYGAWYNFCAASAGNINSPNGCSSDDNYSGGYDICPKGWRLPAQDEFNGIKSNVNTFSPIAGGDYYNGSRIWTDYGFWWSRTASGANSNYYMQYDSSNSRLNVYTGSNKFLGFYVRCNYLIPVSPVTFNYDDNVVGVMVSSASGQLVATVANSGSVINLAKNQTYEMSPVFAADYEMDNISLSGSGELSGMSYTVGASAADIAVTSKPSKLYMWDATSADCGRTLYDNRDGVERTYTTKKIGTLCWMTTNLSLGTDSMVPLVSSTSNVDESYNFPVSSAAGFHGVAVSSIYNAGAKSCSSSQACYGYYTYAAATAGVNPSSGDSGYDICPAGWRLPTRKEFDDLRQTIGGANFVSDWSGVFTGHYENDTFRGGGAYGMYWSSTADGFDRACNLGFDSSGGSGTGCSNGKNGGFAIRCVAKS